MLKHSIVEVLGCSGSIGIPSQGTTSFLIDDDILIDAGTGVCDLDVSRLEKIQHVLITHSHLDHLCALPLLLDTVGVQRQAPLQVYGLPATIKALQNHIFNDVIWPDFSKIPTADAPMFNYQEVNGGGRVSIQGRTLECIEVNHSVPTCGVVLHTQTGAWAYSGDTHQTDDLFSSLNGLPGLSALIIESAFPNSERWLADLSGHLCPELLEGEVAKLALDCEVWITHLKPKDRLVIESEILNLALASRLNILYAGKKFKV